MSPAEQTNLERLKGVYDELLQKEKVHQERSLEYEKKINQMQDELYSRLQEEKDRSTQLTAAFMAQHQQMIEGMYQLMSRMQSAVLSDRDCVPLTQLQSRLFSLGNDQLEAFNAFSVLTTNDKRTKEHIKRKALAKKLVELCEELRSTLRSVESLLAVNTTLLGATKKDLQESTVRIELAIQTFLKVFGKLHLVLNRGEDMHDNHVDGITPSFDRMQREIVNMPALNCVSALEVIETGLHQLGIEDMRGQEGIANGSASMIGWIGSCLATPTPLKSTMGNKGSSNNGAVERERYAALQKQSEIELAAQERLAEQERDSRNKLEDEMRERAAMERRAHEEKMRLEREKMDLLKESSEIQMRMMAENNAIQREIERDAENQRRELERKAREDEMRLREENERKRENERAEAKVREEAKQKEATTAINEANKRVMDMKDKTHAEVTQLIADHHKNTDSIVKENLKNMEAKDAANAEKLEKLSTTYQTQMKETQEMAQKREDALNLERKALDDKYRKDMESASNQSKQEREKMTADYHRIIEEKDRELSRNHQEKEAKIDELNKNHLADLKRAHDDYNKLQESSKAEMERLHREKEENLKEFAARERETAQKMIEMNEKHHMDKLALTNQTTYLLAVQSKLQIEAVRNVNSDKELVPVRILKNELDENARDSCDLWADLEYPIENANEVKEQIFTKSRSIQKNIADLLKTIDKCRSLGDQKKEWKKELQTLEKEYAVPYATSVRRTFRVEEEPSTEKLRELEDQCIKLKEAIQNLPDMEIESMDSLMNKNAQGTIAFTENLGAMKAISHAAKDEKDDEDGGALVIEES